MVSGCKGIGSAAGRTTCQEANSRAGRNGQQYGDGGLFEDDPGEGELRNVGCHDGGLQLNVIGVTESGPELGWC